MNHKGVIHISRCTDPYMHGYSAEFTSEGRKLRTELVRCEAGDWAIFVMDRDTEQVAWTAHHQDERTSFAAMRQVFRMELEAQACIELRLVWPS